jgi:uncharacterized protein (TIGR00290 family)
MSTKKRVLLSWSSGKDSAWALHILQGRDDVELVGMLTTLNQSAERVAMHAVREELLERQALAADLPLTKINLPHPCTNDAYEAIMTEAMAELEASGRVDCIAFGDLFLEDIRAYRERNLSSTPFAPLFPLWGADTTALAGEMIAGGLQAVLTCVDPNQLDPSFCGRAYDAALLADLPSGVDPCGENGEFHSFVHAGPMFRAPIPITVGETVERDGFVFTDVLPA